MRVVIRYVDKDGAVQESFMEYMHCDNGISGEAITEKLIGSITNIGLEVSNLRGQSYDGAGNMAGRQKGAAARISAVEQKPTYIHCNAHQLNLCIARACKILPISYMMATVGSVSKFFNLSPKHQGTNHRRNRKMLNQ